LHQKRGLGWGMLVMMNFSRGRSSLDMGHVPEGCPGEVSCPGRCLLAFLMTFPESVLMVLREVRTTGELKRCLLPRSTSKADSP
jgi:hypothetical protein